MHAKIKVSGNSQGSNPISPCSNHNGKKKKPLLALWRVGLETTGHKITGCRRRNRGFKQRWNPQSHKQTPSASLRRVRTYLSQHRITDSWENGRLSTTCIQWQLTEWNCEPAMEKHHSGGLSRAFPNGLTKRNVRGITTLSAFFSMHTYTCFTFCFCFQ